MRARTFALVGLVAGLGVAAAADPVVDYTLYATADGRYKVLFPGPVKTETSQIKTPTGDRTLTFESVKLSERVTFMVTYIDVADDVAKGPPGPRLDKVRDGNKGADGKLISEADATVGPEKYPARDIVVGKPTTFLRNRVVLAGNRLYQVMVQGPQEFVGSKVVDRYFDSFEVTK